MAYSLIRSVWRAIFLVLPITAGLALSACSTTTAPPLSAADAAKVGDEYRLGLGDKLRVNVYGERDLSGEFQVSGSGTIDMPLIGAVPAVGLTARALQERLTTSYAQGYLKDPKVSVEVYDFRPYYILGEVNKPGQYPSREGITIEGAIATAGGYTYRADRKKVFLRRVGDAKEYEVSPVQPVHVAPGDVIRVGERYF